MKKGFILPLLIVIIAVAALAAAFYVGKKSSGSTATNPVVTQQASPAPSPITDPTANWKTKQIKLLTFKYPGDWEEMPKGEGGWLDYRPIDTDKIFLGINPNTYHPSNGTCEQLAQQALSNEQPSNKKVIEVDKHEAIYQEINSQDSTRIEVYICNVADDIWEEGTANGTHSVFMEIRDKNQLQTSRTMLNQILSTFKYTQ